jgi:hypothetical protein
MDVILVALFALLLGMGFTFWGYRVFLVLLPIWGFFAGLWFGAETINLLIGDGFLATTTGWIVGFFTGIVFAALSYLFYVLGVAIVAGAVGAALVSGILGWIGIDSGIFHFLLMMVGAVIVAVLTLSLNLQKIVIIILTAIAGANGILLSILLILGRVELRGLETAGNSIRPILADSTLWLLVWLAIAAFGVVTQMRFNRSFEFSQERYRENW